MRAPLAAEVVEWDLLLQVIWAALAAGTAITLAMSLAIVGATRWMEANRERRPAAQLAYGILFTLAMTACAAGVVLGVVVMTSKG